MGCTWCGLSRAEISPELPEMAPSGTTAFFHPNFSLTKGGHLKLNNKVESHLIFGTGTTSGAYEGKNLPCEEFFSTWQTMMRKNSPHYKSSVEEIFPHGRYGDKSVMWRNVETNLSCGEISPPERRGHKSDLSQFMLFCRKICFVAI